MRSCNATNTSMRYCIPENKHFRILAKISGQPVFRRPDTLCRKTCDPYRDMTRAPPVFRGLGPLSRSRPREQQVPRSLRIGRVPLLCRYSYLARHRNNEGPLLAVFSTPSSFFFFLSVFPGKHWAEEFDRVVWLQETKQHNRKTLVNRVCIYRKK